MGRAGPAHRCHRAVRHGPRDRARARGHLDRPLAGPPGEAVSALAPLALEAGLGLLLLIVFVAGLTARGEDRRGIAWMATGGVLVLLVIAMLLPPTGPALGGMFVQDGLAIFVKRLFLAATFIGLLAGLSGPDRGFARGGGHD